jgi:hypothetical protein
MDTLIRFVIVATFVAVVSLWAFDNYYLPAEPDAPVSGSP